MKISNNVNLLYSSKHAFYEILKKKIDNFVLNGKDSKWHYESRIKGIESFTQKLETGRFTSENIFDDYFACTIVVKNNLEIPIAIQFIKKFAVIIQQKPPIKEFTHKKSYEFSFDDMRLYAKYLNQETGALSEDVLNCVFEIQIKTFLQHAWSIATHDLIYKSPLIHWGKERIAYQVKAALEHAEITIASIEKLCENEELNKENSEVKKINKTITYINKCWNEEELPFDKRRLAQNILNVLEQLGLNLNDLKLAINHETENGRGLKTLNLTPYLIVIQSICNQYPETVDNYIKSGVNKIFISDDIDRSMIHSLSNRL